MRKHTLLPVIALMLLLGCVHNSTSKPVTPNLPTNARDTADANAFRVIADAWAFLSSVNTSVTSGKLTLTPQQKTLYNDTVAAYNTAYAIGLAYHNGSGSQANLTTATSALQTKLTAASSQITVTP